MDAKEASLFKYYYDKLVALTFDEKDIYALLILVRELSKGQEVNIWELANFVAHRERNRGEFLDVLSRTTSFFNAAGIKLGDVFEVKPVFDDQEIKDSFNSLFARLGFAPVSGEVANGILLSIIALPHDARVVKKDKTEIGTLLFAYDQDMIYLFGRFSVQDVTEFTHLQVPLLQIRNHYLSPSSSELQTPSMVEVVNDAARSE